MNFNDVATIAEILNVEDVTIDKVMEIVENNPDTTMQCILEQYIKKFNPDLYELHQKGSEVIVDYSQYKHFTQYAYEKRLIIDGFMRNESHLYQWPDELNRIISSYYSYFILCNLKSSNFDYVSPKGIFMESYCKINNKNLEINKKPADEGVDGRGIHLITIENTHAEVINVDNLDVWGSFQDGKRFIKQCKNIQPNAICFMFLKDSGETYSEGGLTELCNKYNIATKHTQWRETFICIFETNATNDNSNVYYECVGDEQTSIHYQIAIKLSQDTS